MPIPLIIIGAGVIAGATGAGASVKAAIDKITADGISEESKDALNNSVWYIDRQRELCGESLSDLADMKLNILSGSIKKFVDTFEQIKNVDFKECENLDEFSKYHLDNSEFEEMKTNVEMALPMVGGAAAGAGAGALVAFGAYGATQAFACASTGTAISALSGAAASNATLAFLGGGALAQGGLGIAGGTMVLGSIVAGPTLLVMGIVAGICSKKNLENARIEQENIKQTIAELGVVDIRCRQIRRRVYIYENLLSSLDAKLYPLVFQMEDIIKNEGFDYRKYSNESKKIISSAASTAVSIKGILDKAILDNDGNLTDDNDV